MRLHSPRTYPGRQGQSCCRAAPIPPGGSAQTADREQSHPAHVPPPAAKTLTQTPAPAPEFCTSSSWQRSAFFSCFSLDLVVGKVAAQLLRGGRVGLITALVKQNKAHQLH